MSVASKSMKLSDAKKRVNSRGSYISEMKEELSKVSWTTKDELKNLAKIVIGATFVFGIGVYLSDLVVKGALDGLLTIVRAIWG